MMSIILSFILSCSASFESFRIFGTVQSDPPLFEFKMNVDPQKTYMFQYCKISDDAWKTHSMFTTSGTTHSLYFLASELFELKYRLVEVE